MRVVPLAAVSALTALSLAFVGTAAAPGFTASDAATGHASLRAPTRFDLSGRVGGIRLGASKNAVIRAWGVPTDIRKSGATTELVFGSRLIVRTDAKRIREFEVFGAGLRARKGAKIGDAAARWQRESRRLQTTPDGALVLDHPGGNLSVLNLRNGRVVSVVMVWKGGSARSGAGAGEVSAGRGSAGNPFAGSPPAGRAPCANDGRSGWCWCTWWAHEKRPDVYTNSHGKNGVPNGGWDAKRWADFASRGGGFPLGTQPVVGSLVVFPSGQWGHIAYVESVNADNSFLISEYNRGNDGHGPTTRTIPAWQIASLGLKFIYGGPATGGEFIGRIVQWAGDAKTQKTSWLVVNRSGRPRRNWIPTAAIFYCLKGQGSQGPEARDVLPSEYLSTWLPDNVGEHAACGGGAGGEPTPTTPTPTTPTPTNPTPTNPTPVPTPPKWAEQQGSLGANTFTNPYNASGLGPKIAPYQWVDVSCKVLAPQIASANPDGYWYRIASPPWNNQYYAVANTFWNGDVPGQKPYTHNTDFSVANC